MSTSTQTGDLSWTSEGSPFETGSSILREAPPFLSNARHTEHGGEDLSLSELYLDSEYSRSHSERHDEPFSLLARDSKKDYIPDNSTSERRPSEATASSGKQPSLSRREQLQRDLFILKKLNASMSAYITAIGSVSTATNNVATQMDRTERLLNLYVDLLRETERNSQLIFDETWQGGSDDMNTLTKLKEAAAEKERKEREEREQQVRMEKERAEREERERLEKEAKERRDRERAAAKLQKATRGMRGVSRGRVQVNAASGRGGASAIPALRTGAAAGRRV